MKLDGFPEPQNSFLVDNIQNVQELSKSTSYLRRNLNLKGILIILKELNVELLAPAFQGNPILHSEILQVIWIYVI